MFRIYLISYNVSSHFFRYSFGIQHVNICNLLPRHLGISYRLSPDSSPSQSVASQREWRHNYRKMPDKILVKGMVVPCACFGCRSRFAGTFTHPQLLCSVRTRLVVPLRCRNNSVLSTSKAQCPSDSNTLLPSCLHVSCLITRKSESFLQMGSSWCEDTPRARWCNMNDNNG